MHESLYIHDLNRVHANKRSCLCLSYFLRFKLTESCLIMMFIVRKLLDKMSPGCYAIKEFTHVRMQLCIACEWCISITS